MQQIGRIDTLFTDPNAGIDPVPALALGIVPALDINPATLEREALKKHSYLPDVKDLTSVAKAQQELLYLSTIRRNQAQRSPYTLQEERVFNAAKLADGVTFVALWVNIAVIFVFASLSLINLIAWDKKLSAGVVGTIVGIVGLVQILPQVYATFATGINPDWASRTANRQQDAIGEVKDRFKNLGITLVNYHFNKPLLAQLIAQEMKIEELKSALISHSGLKSAELVVRPLEEACNFVNTQFLAETPINAEVYTYIYSKLSKGTLETLG
jgi:hypothetical protein